MGTIPKYVIVADAGRGITIMGLAVERGGDPIYTEEMARFPNISRALLFLEALNAQPVDGAVEEPDEPIEAPTNPDGSYVAADRERYDYDGGMQ